MSSNNSNTPVQVPELTPEELEAKLADIRARIASVEHGSCETLRDRIMELVPQEDMNLLMDRDPLVGNLCCLFMQAGEQMARMGMTLPVIRVEVVQRGRRRRRGDDGPKTPPTA